jgi:hypothetical protein
MDNEGMGILDGPFPLIRGFIEDVNETPRPYRIEWRGPTLEVANNG